MKFRATLILGFLFVLIGAYVYLVEFRRAAEEAKGEKLVTFDPADVSAVALSYPDREILLERVDDTWRLTTPVDARANDAIVNNLIDAIAECEVTRTLDDVPEDLAPFGLDEPEVTVKVTLTDRELPPIRVGNISPIGFSTYVMREDEPKIYLVSSAFQTGMDKKPADLRDRSLLAFNEDDVQKISLHRKDGDVVLTRANGGWQIEEPGPYPAISRSVQNLLTAMGELRVMSFVSDDPSVDLAPYGLDSPRLSVDVSFGPDDETRLLVGDQSDKGDVYVKIADIPSVYAVGDWNYSDLNMSGSDFRDKTILTFAETDVTAVEVAPKDSESFVLVRDEAGTWSIGDQEAIDYVVDDMLGELSRLHGYEIVTDEVEGASEYGLTEPILTLTVQGKNDEPIGEVRFGSHSPHPPSTEYTAIADGRPTIFHVREFLFSRLNRGKSDYLPVPTTTPAPTETASSETAAAETPTAEAAAPESAEQEAPIPSAGE